MTLEPSALYLLRRQAVRGGMSQNDAARTFEASLRAISKWRQLDREGGLRALMLKRRGRRPGEGRLNAKRAARICSLIVGKMPDQLSLPSYLWTAGSGGEPDCAGIRDRGVARDGGTVPPDLGPEPAEVGAVRLREERCGHRAVAVTGIPGDRPAGQAGTCHHLLGRRNGAAE